MKRLSAWWFGMPDSQRVAIGLIPVGIIVALVVQQALGR